jgi:hypothetical protein
MPPAVTIAASPNGLRIVDPPMTQGLFESIVGGIAGFFFGA